MMQIKFTALSFMLKPGHFLGKNDFLKIGMGKFWSMVMNREYLEAPNV